MIKSKKTTVKLLICVLVMLALATVLVACNIGYSPDDYDYLVTFEYNVGTGDNALEGNTPTQRLGVFENSLVIIRPGYSSDFSEGIVDGYYLEGWYLPAYIDEDGEPMRDSKGFVVLGQKWNFYTMRVNEDITLYGNFVKKLQIRFLYKNKDNVDEYIDHKIEYTPGSRVYEPTDNQIPTLTGHTFLGKYYTTAERDTEFDWKNLTITKDIDIYVDFIEGIWRLVKTASEFRAAIGNNRNIYLQDNIDFEGLTIWNFSEYKGEINGNGYKISNVKRSIVASKPHHDDKINCFGGIFGSLSEEASIHDIIFENVVVDFEVNQSYLSLDAYVGVLAGRIAEGAKLANVTVSGKFTYKTVSNKTIYVGADTDYYGIIGENNGNIKDCNFSQVEITVA